MLGSQENLQFFARKWSKIGITTLTTALLFSSMGIEFHNQPDWLSKYVEVSNLVFSVIFSIEMILKLSAYGFFRYISDGFNVFDGLIVILRFAGVNLCLRPLFLIILFRSPPC
jgi:hypothetical protein